MWQLPRIATEDILLYLRKSRTDDPTLTIEEVLSKHEQMLDEWVERNLPGCGGRIPEQNRFREIVSGETIDSRPAVREVLRLAESPKYKALLIVEPQRLSRGDLEDIGRLVKILRYTNTIVITLQYTYDLNDERDRDAFERELKRGNEFLEYQKRIMTNGRLLSVENGNYIGTTPPYGYKKISVREGKKSCPTLEPIPEEAKVVNMIYDMYLQGMGTVSIGDRLMELGIPSPNGGKWGRSTVANVLDNVHYVGKVRWNYKKVTKSVKDGQVVKHRPTADQYLVFPGKHPAIVDDEKFYAVQEKRGSLPRRPKGAKLKNPLAGILKCQCGSIMSYIEPARHRGGSPRFACRMVSRCKTGTVMAPEMLDFVKRSLEQAVEDFETQIENGTDNTIEIYTQAVKRMEKRLAELEELEATQWEKYTLEGMPKHVFDRLNEKVLAEKHEVEEALCAAKDSIPEPVDFEERLATFKTALEMMNNPEADMEQLNTVLKKCIKRITYNRPARPTGQLVNDAPFTAEIELVIPHN